jgi:hypothetical protein
LADSIRRAGNSRITANSSANRPPARINRETRLRLTSWPSVASHFIIFRLP